MKRLRKKISVIIEKTNDGYSAYAEDLNVFTAASNITELYSNLIEALNLYYEDEAYLVTHHNLSLKLDFKQFFKHYRVLNANFLAYRIGMNPTLLSQYVSGKKTPSPKQTQKIINGIHTIGNELAELELIA